MKEAFIEGFNNYELWKAIGQVCGMLIPIILILVIGFIVYYIMEYKKG